VDHFSVDKNTKIAFFWNPEAKKLASSLKAAAGQHAKMKKPRE